MTNRKRLLDHLLHALVQEWGREAVESALAALPDDSEAARHRGHANDSKRPASARRQRLLATEQVARAQLADAQKDAVRQLAARFDCKQFLPRISDVREFLFMLGERPGPMNDRSDSFRYVLLALSKLPQERLNKLLNSAIHSGPSQLGPLSDAIAAAAASIPRNREPETS